VNIGVNFILNEKPDLIVSGINKGGNVGSDVNYSGTVAAAVEGTLLGIPSFAISLVADRDFNFTPAADFACRLAQVISKEGLPSKTLLNVNVPDTQGGSISKYKITTQGKNPHNNTIEQRTDPRGGSYFWIGRENGGFEDEDATDHRAISQGFISVTPLQVDRTNYATLKDLNRWDL
jgi:5'-nucleotidase